MTDPGRPAQHPGEQVPSSPSGAVPHDTSGATAAGEPAAAPPTSSSVQRMQRFTAANMLRSLGPLVLICLVLVAFPALRASRSDPVREVDTTSSERTAAELASYPLLVPRGLSDGWRPTSVRTNAGSASAGDPVTLQIGWFTPGEEYAAYVVSDDPRDPALDDVLAGATDAGTADIDGQTWQRRTTARGETALTRDDEGATLLVTGSAGDDELGTLAGSLEPYAP
ncbi:DUF4245 domain-containing protein [Modestobacter sp. SSW1-42]|uniref:DUF4245 domain-containing protein n=1 Tax=Modestobacter sp. SSW1-42 TaxID=596372 RepID=UPI0039862FFF